MAESWDEIVRAYESDFLPVDDPDARSVALMRAVLAGAGALSVGLLLRWKDGRFTSLPEQPVTLRIGGTDRLVNESEILWEGFDPIDATLIDWGTSSARLLANGEELARLSLNRPGGWLLFDALPVAEFRLAPGSLIWYLRSP